MPTEIPDNRDGLTRLQRVCLVELDRLQRERPGRTIPVIQLYGRVVERFDCSEEQLRAALDGLGADVSSCS